MSLVKKSLATAAMIVATIGSANAAIIGGAITGGSAQTNGGTFEILSAPLGNPLGAENTVGQDTFNTDNLYAFNELQNVVLGSDVTLEGSIVASAGTVIDSHYVFFDPGPSTSLEGYVDFDATVIGVITSTALLVASDFLANPAVNYINPEINLRGLESNDAISFAGSRVTIDWRASSPGDFVRVLTISPPTTEIPVPGALPLMLTALAGGAFLRRRKAK